MGIIQKAYCDVCGVETNIGNFLSVTEEMPSVVTVMKINLCAGCYSDIVGYFKKRKTLIDSNWVLPEVPSVEFIPEEIVP